MSHHEARMTSKGQLTVPAPIRKFLNLKAGDIVDFYLDERTRCVRVRARNRPIESLFGILNKYVDPEALPLTQDQIDQAIGDYLAEDDARIMRQYQEWQEFLKWRRSKRQDAAE
jgi:AbrB family looped-hinge helix DNA binding protein